MRSVKNFVLILSVFLLIIFIPACDNDIMNPESNLTEKLFGSWDLNRAVKISDSTQDVIPSGFQTITFNDDHTFRIEMQNLHNSGNWVVVGNDLMLEFTNVQIDDFDENIEYPFPFEVTNGSLIITSAWDFDNDPDAAAILHYTKM